MADTLASDLFIPEVAQSYARQAFSESLGMMRFVGGPGSPIEMIGDPVFAQEGQYLERPVFKRIASLGTRRDLTSVSTATDLELTGGNEKAVKVHKKLGPVSYSLDAERVSRAAPGNISMEVGKQFGEFAGQLVRDTLLNAVRGAIAAMTSTLHTVDVWNASARTNLSTALLNRLRYTMSDKSKAGWVTIMRPEAGRDLIDELIGRGTNLGDAAVLDGILQRQLGMSIEEVAAAALTTADAGFDKAHTLLLGPGAVQIGFSLPLTIYPEFQDISKEQVLMRARADFDYWVGIRGMAYNSGAGGANPTDATLLSSANWSVVYSDAREVNLAEGVHNAAGLS